MKQVYFLPFLLFFSILSSKCLSQANTINTDRPDQGDGTYTVPKNQFQIEDGFTVAKETFINNLMVRYGVTNTTEIRMLIDGGKETGISGVKPVTLSVKQRIIEQEKAIPAITLVGYVSSGRIATRHFQNDDVPFEIKLAFENELTDKFTLGYNIGTSNNFHNLNLTAGIGYQANDRVSALVEYFSTFSRQKPEHNIDIGILYLVKPWFQLDADFGHSAFDSDGRFFITFGVSYFFGSFPSNVHSRSMAAVDL